MRKMELMTAKLQDIPSASFGDSRYVNGSEHLSQGFRIFVLNSHLQCHLPGPTASTVSLLNSDCIGGYELLPCQTIGFVWVGNLYVLMAHVEKTLAGNFTTPDFPPSS